MPRKLHERSRHRSLCSHGIRSPTRPGALARRVFFLRNLLGRRFGSTVSCSISSSAGSTSKLPWGGWGVRGRKPLKLYRVWESAVTSSQSIAEGSLKCRMKRRPELSQWVPELKLAARGSEMKLGLMYANRFQNKPEGVDSCPNKSGICFDSSCRFPQCFGFQFPLRLHHVLFEFS